MHISTTSLPPSPLSLPPPLFSALPFLHLIPTPLSSPPPHPHTSLLSPTSSPHLSPLLHLIPTPLSSPSPHPHLSPLFFHLIPTPLPTLHSLPPSPPQTISDLGIDSDHSTPKSRTPARVTSAIRRGVSHSVSVVSGGTPLGEGRQKGIPLLSNTAGIFETLDSHQVSMH